MASAARVRMSLPAPAYSKPCRLLLVTLAALLLSLPAAETQAQTASEAKVLAWDCWIGAEGIVKIRCILCRDKLPPSDLDDDLESALLEHIHSRIHSGQTSELDRLVQQNAQIFRDTSLWTIFIHSLPYDSSWLEQRPQRLVRAVLCPQGYECPVLLPRP